MKLKYYHPEAEAEESHTWCVLCGKAYSRYELDFWDGLIEPSEGDILEGKNSGETGTVDSVNLLSGAWGAHAKGTVVFKAGTGSSDFDVNETIMRSGDTMMYVTASTRRHHGRLYPKRALILREGRYYCKPHYRFRFRHRDRDKQKIQIQESKDD